MGTDGAGCSPRRAGTVSVMSCNDCVSRRGMEGVDPLECLKTTGMA